MVETIDQVDYIANYQPQHNNQTKENIMHPIQKFFPDIQGSKAEILHNLSTIQISKPVLFVAMTARTGSTAFCSLLEKDKRIGTCHELFNPRGPIQAEFKKAAKKNMLFSEYIQRIDQEIAKDFFTFKISWQDYQFFVDFKLDQILFKSASFIFLDRFDIEKQAVSLFYSTQTNMWHSDQKNFDELDKKERQVTFDRQVLDLITVNLINEKKGWWNHFYSNKINPLLFYYENFTKKFDPAYTNILQNLSIKKEININWEQTSVQKFHSGPKDELVRTLKNSKYGEHASRSLTEN